MRSLIRIASVVATFVMACSDSGGGDGSSVSFHGEAAAMPGFSYDTGPQPPVGPATVDFTLSSGGSITADTAATQSGGMLNGTAGAGAFALDMHVKMAGHLKFDASGVHYDGDIPGMQNVDIAIGGTTPFDGFAMQGDPVKLVVNVPETALPPIPLGGVPGNLQLTVSSSSTITTTFRGACLQVQGGTATFTGETVTSGTLVLDGSIIPDVPLVDPIPLPTITVNLPASDAALPFGPVAVTVQDGMSGNCNGVIGGDAGGGSDASHGDAAGKDSGGHDGGSNPEDVLIDSSLVAHYKFNEGSGTAAVDATGHGHTGALGGNIQWFGGKMNSAMYFDGSTTSADMGAFSFTNTNGTWTIMFWAYPDVLQDNRCLLDANIDSFSGGPRFNEYSGGLALDFASGSNAIAPVAVHTWHHVALTSDFGSSLTSVYFDGANPVTVSTTNFIVAFNHFVVGNGNENGASGTHYQGLLDDLRIYDRAVTSAEVAQVYNAQK